MTSAIEKVAMSSAAIVISRLMMFLTLPLFGTVTWYYTQTTSAQADTLATHQVDIIALKTWREVMEAEGRRDADNQRDIRAELSVIRGSNEQIKVAIEGLTVTLRMMQSSRSAMLGGWFTMETDS